MKVQLNNVRLAFPVLFAPKAVKAGDTPAFSASLIFSKDHAAYKIVAEAINAIGQEKWGAKWPEMRKGLAAQDRLCLHNGDAKTQYEGFADNFYISARSKIRPGTFNRDGTEVVEADGKLYAGCYVIALLELWAQDNSFGKRINAGLRGVKFYADGDAFSGGGKAAAGDEFESFGDAETVSTSADDFF